MIFYAVHLFTASRLWIEHELQGEAETMRKSEIQEFFDKAKAFNVAFGQITQEGYFDNLSVTLSGSAGYDIWMHVKASGYVPDDAADKLSGLMPYVDPAQVLEKIREQMSTNPGYKLVHTNCEITMRPWDKYDRTGNKVIGRLGQHMSLELSARVCWKGKGKPPR